MRKIRIAQIGLNANSHSIPVWFRLMRNTEVFDLAGYVLPEGEREKYPDKMEQLEGYPELTLQQVLEDETIEAVAVETDEIYLTKYALLAAKAGKHIHMEKPGGVSPEAFEELIGIMKKTGKVFHVGYMYRYNPVIREAIARVKRGELGTITSVEAHMSAPHTPQVRQWLENFPGGMMFFLGCHLVDLVLQIQGKPLCVTPFNCCTDTDGVTALDYGMAVLEYPNGVSFVKTNAHEPGGYARRQLVITGTKATLELKPLELQASETKTSTVIVTDKTCYDNYASWQDTGVFTPGQPHHRYDDMMVTFARMVAGEVENPYPYDYELELFRLLLQCCGGKDQ